MTITENKLMVKVNAIHVQNANPNRAEKHTLFLILAMAVLGLLTIFIETMVVLALPSLFRSPAPWISR